MFFYRISVITLIFYFCKQIFAFKSPYYKLPSAILPSKYHLHISTLIHQNILAYNGSVSIDLIIREPTNEIVLNSKQLRQFNITLINLKTGLSLKSPQLEYKLDETKEQIRIFSPTVPFKLQTGEQYRLNIDFIGDIQDKEIFGFYKTTYLDGNNKTVSIATTHFEPTGARLAFPCFDEPVFKAKFVLSITHGTNYSAISNMPADGDSIFSSTPNGEMATTKFLQTPKMSTYLVAFAITNFNKTIVVVNGLEHRFFYPPNFEDNYGSRALENAVKTVGAFEKLFGIKYTLPKLDHIQIEKIWSVAMENWGLMTFQKNFILINQKDYNKMELLHVIRVQNHEIAHNWFGNLVTPASWNQFWLKEGFSTYFSYIVGILVYPEENILENFIINEVLHVFLHHPLTSVIKEGENIMNYLDSIAYQLGAGFVRMFHHAIGNSTFMKGIFNYLSIFQYSVADENDFFTVMQAAVDEDNVHLFQNNQSIANVMRTWTHNLGIPIVRIIRNYETGTITIQQKPFSTNEDQKWWIPMSFATAANPDFERTTADYIMPPQSEVTLDLNQLNISLSNSDWLIVNKQFAGIFYVIYDDLNLKLITEALRTNHKTIHVFNRALFFRDLSVNFDEELDAIEPILELLQYLKLEEEPLPWFCAFDLIFDFITKLEGSKASEKFKSFIYDTLIGIYNKKYQSPIDNLTVTDLIVKKKIMKLKFQIDTISCQNYTTESAKKNFLNGIGATWMICKLSLCQFMQNVTVQEFQAYLSRLASFDTKSIEFYEFEMALQCVESNELFKYLLEINSSDDEKISFKNLLIFNKSFRAWVFKYHISKLEELGLSDINEIIDEEDMTRKTFWSKYGNNIDTWLENYDRDKSGLGRG